jgi:hypothetical protein
MAKNDFWASWSFREVKLVAIALIARLGNCSAVDTYDVVVLGTGASGRTAALTAVLTAVLTAAGHGASVGLFEKGHEVNANAFFCPQSGRLSP